MSNPVIGAIFRRDLRRWFGSPAGYVFITLFVLGAAMATFWPDQFFQRNLASLDTLNDWYPVLLLFFIPAITMSVWAGERGQGTDELLFTLPAKDGHIVLGKFLAAGGIYTVALLFTLPVVLFLAWLGDPDWGLLLSNYLGLWLLGLTLISVGMIGSQLSDNLTVAFILGLLLCGFVVIFETLLEYVLPGVAQSWRGYGPVSLFEEMGRGIVSLSAVLLYVAIIAAFLYLNLLLLSRRHWIKGRLQGVHLAVRFACLLVVAAALTGIGANAGARADLTYEQVHSLSDETIRLLDELPDDKVVAIQAYVSTEVPADYVRTRRTLLDLLRQYDTLGGDNIEVRVVDTERFTEEAQEAERLFNIRHETRVIEEQGRTRTADLYMGLAFTCGIEEVVIPFLDKGLPVEYELTRSIRVVAAADRKKVGILETDVKVFGGFDFQSGRQDPEWDIVKELKLQYEVERVAADQDYPEGLDVLVAVMPSTMNQEQMDRLGAYIKTGKPVLIVDDPVPMSAPGMAPEDPKGGQRNPFMSQGQPPPEPKGDIFGMLADMNIRWPTRDVVWDLRNPHPQFSEFDRELVFLGGDGAFNEDSVITSGLQEVVSIFGGHVADAGKDQPRFVPLIRSSPLSGTIPTSRLFSQSFFGKQLNPMRRYVQEVGGKVVAARVTGDGEAKANLIFIADLDMIASQFFQIRRQGFENMAFDNVTFLLNCVDDLAGDRSFIELRKRRPVHRTLTLIEEKERDFNEVWLRQKDAAEAKAETALAQAQEDLNNKVKAIENRQDLDEQSKAIQIQTVRDVEQRRLDVKREDIEDQKAQAIDDALSKRLAEEREIRVFYRAGAVILAPIPAILFGLYSLLRRSNRERESVDQRRIAGGAAA